MKRNALFLLLASIVSFLSFAEPRINEKEVFSYDAPDRKPIWFGGESRAENVKGGGRYSIFLDIFYADGSHTWAKQALFPSGSHDWVHSEEVFYPPKPVKKIHFYRLFQKKSGKVEFRNVFLKRETPPDGYVSGVRRYSMLPLRKADRLEKTVYRDGKETIEFDIALNIVKIDNSNPFDDLE